MVIQDAPALLPAGRFVTAAKRRLVIRHRRSLVLPFLYGLVRMRLATMMEMIIPARVLLITVAQEVPGVLWGACTVIQVAISARKARHLPTNRPTSPKLRNTMQWRLILTTSRRTTLIPRHRHHRKLMYRQRNMTRMANRISETWVK